MNVKPKKTFFSSNEFGKNSNVSLCIEAFDTLVCYRFCRLTFSKIVLKKGIAALLPFFVAWDYFSWSTSVYYSSDVDLLIFSRPEQRILKFANYNQISLVLGHVHLIKVMRCT